MGNLAKTSIVKTISRSAAHLIEKLSTNEFVLDMINLQTNSENLVKSKMNYPIGTLLNPLMVLQYTIK